MTSRDALQGLMVRSVEDVSISSGEDKDIMMSGGAVTMSSAVSTAISSRSIELSSGWNQQIAMDANGGFVTLGAVKMTGSRVSSDDAMHGITMRSKEDVEIAAADDSDVMVSGGNVVLSATNAVDVTAGSISLSSQWGGNIELSPTGGSVVMDSLTMSGSQLSSVDQFGGMTVRSEEEDVEIGAGKSVSV